MKKFMLLGILLIVKQITFSQCLNGIYTIGGASPSFTSITQAVNTLTVNGVCGPVTFNIRPGTYNEKIIIPNVVGTSSLNTITFQADNGDSSSVIIQSANGSSGNYIIRLDAAHFVNIQKMSFITTDATYSGIFYIINGSNTIKVSNCQLSAPIVSSIAGNRTLISSNGILNSGLIIQNNKIEGGEMGVYVGSGGGVSNLLVDHNLFIDQYNYGISLNNVCAPQIISNKLRTSLNNTAYRTLYLSSCSQSLLIEKNHIEQAHGDGIAVISHSATAGNTSRICNNKINISGTLSSKFGIYLQNGGDFDVFHNTVVTTNTTATSACLYLTSMTNVSLKNNILCNKSAGNAMNIGFVNTFVSDFNDLYTNGSTLVYNYGNKTFGAWKALGYDANSLNVLPQFISSSDFHISYDFTQNWPTPFISSVQDDIEGTLRDNISPYIGAYEYANVLFTEDANVYKISIATLNCPGLQPAKILLRNLGANPLTSVTINWSVNGALQTPFNWSGNLFFFDTTTVTIGNMNFANLGTYSITAWSSLPNGSIDNFPQNDSATSPVAYTALNGIYTIGGSSPSFSNITTAMVRLKNSGVCGNVTFNIRNGTYSENFDLQSINGLNGAGSLLIQSELGVTANVSITSSGTINPVCLSNVSNVTFKNIGIHNSNSHLFELKSGCNNIEINGCEIWAGSAAYYGVRGFLTSGNVNNLRILNNDIWGSIGIQLSAAPYKFNNVKITGNVFRESSVYLIDVDTLLYTTNTGTIIGSGNGQWIEINNSSNIVINKNKIHSNHPITSTSALSLKTVNNALVSNNFLIGNGGLGTLSLYYVSNVHVINNSVNCISPTSGSVAFYLSNSGSGNKIWNNIFQNSSGGLAVDIVPSATQLSLRNNAYYTQGYYFGRFNYNPVLDFTAWRTVSQMDTNSIFDNAQFTSLTDLHVNDILLNNAGIPVFSDITDDFDGQIRDASAPDIGADEFSPYSLDVGTSGFTFGHLICAGNNNLEVILKNNGTTGLTSAIVKFSVNGTAFSPYNWSGMLAPSTETIISFGNYNFLQGTQYTLKAWSESPNGSTDVFKTNDTTTYVFESPGMSGLYTIGGSSPSFPTIVSAVTALKKSGVCGPVTFNIRNGVYNEQINIPNIKGTSDVNMVQFQSENLDSTLVSIEYASGPANNYIMSVDSADHVVFYKLGFKPLSTIYSNVLKYSSSAKYAEVKNCSFIGQPSLGVLLEADYTTDSILVSGNRFYKGATSFSSSGIYSVVRNNVFEEQSVTGVSVSKPNFDISSNYFNYTNSNCKSVVVGSGSGGKINKNKIIYGVTTNTAISVTNCGSADKKLLISNNFISLSGGVAIYLSGVHCIKIIHNSVNQRTNGICLKYSNLDSSSCKNNIFYNQTGTCISSIFTGPGFMSDYNCIYSQGNLLATIAGTTYTSLPVYTASLNMDSHSVSVDPMYSSSTDLHISNTTIINNAGSYTGDVIDDMDGEYRSTSTPDIGADEIQTPVLSNVWPGDTDNDLTVSSQDLYAIGLGYGSHKYARDSISNLYIAHSSYDWWIPQINGQDLKHADCNGDSIINMSDTLAIHLNYNLAHAPKVFSTSTSTVTDIYVVYNKSVYFEGDTVKADIMLGSASNIKTNMYGLSFKLNYDESLVKVNSEQMKYVNSWMGNLNSTIIKFSKISHSSGVMDASSVRITHTDTNGYGKIGTFQFILKDTLSSGRLNISITDANKIDHNGLSLPLVSGTDSVIVDLNGLATSVEERSFNEISIHPNPASDNVVINFMDTNVQYNAELRSMDGKIILIKQLSANHNSVLDLNNISRGIYVLKLIMKDGRIKIFKLVVQ